MSDRPDISVIVSTFERPWHLARCLYSIELQREVPGELEVVVADDGSRDETLDVVRRFARRVQFPVRLTTHLHDGFHLTRSRNEAFLQTAAPYVLFCDGDCLLPPDHLRQHLVRRREGVVMAGDCYRLGPRESCLIDGAAIFCWQFPYPVCGSERRRLLAQHWKNRFYRLIRHRRKPKLIGNNIGIWREDFERVNGFDEEFQGWGGEDDDLNRRLRATGLSIRSIMRHSPLVHLWHPTEPTVPEKWSEGSFVCMLRDVSRPTACRRGLVYQDLETIGQGPRSAARPPLECYDFSTEECRQSDVDLREPLLRSPLPCFEPAREAA